MKTTLRTGLLTVEDAGWQWDGAYLPRHGPSPLPPGRGIFYLLNIMPVSFSP
ncbi:hypothetical protein [Halalkalibaculum sp. DA384]|uniref:hypothetical protein n=1 Tax=Halalkalibaculum sp. DA384 TaxID=3373606 RepID=UPI003754FE92